MIFEFSIADKDRTAMFEYLEKNDLILISTDRKWTYRDETGLRFIYTVDVDPEVFLLFKLSVLISMSL